MNLRATTIALALAGALAVPAVAHDVGERGERDTGFTSSEIRTAQRRLDDLGYPVGRTDGVLGPKTHTALKNFQRDKGLNATGELNEETLQALRAEERGGSATSGTRSRY
jgi:peptidoglycan hydrolase-like protein with peptidoglycan-binding domain